MAKNIKGRKFVATAASAALVASAIVPVASAAEFADQSKVSDWAVDAVEYLVGEGIMSGKPGNEFDPKGKLTRGETAKIIALALGLEVDETAKTTFADAKDHWSSAYVAALQAHNKDIISGNPDGTFAPNANVTREQLAKMIVVAFGLELVEDKAVDFTDNNTWAAEYVNILASNGIVAGITDTTFAPKADVTREQAAVFAHRTLVEEVRIGYDEVTPEVTPEPTPEVTPAELAVESVTAINLTQVAVVFNQKVDENTATSVANYKLSITDSTNSDSINTPITLTGSNAMVNLLPDGKTVVITLVDSKLGSGKTLTNLADNKVYVTGVRTADRQKEIKDFSRIFKAADTAAPTVASTTVKGNRTIEVQFTEDVQNVVASSFKLNGKALSTYSLRGVSYNPVTYKATISFGADLAAGDYELTVSSGNATLVGNSTFADMTNVTGYVHKNTTLEGEETPGDWFVYETGATVKPTQGYLIYGGGPNGMPTRISRSGEMTYDNNATTSADGLPTIADRTALMIFDAIDGFNVLSLREQMVTVYNLQGHVIFHQYMSEGQQIHITTVSGIYVVKGETETIKLMVD